MAYDFYTLIVLGLAAWRLSSLLVDEEGPFLIFLRLRLLIGVGYVVNEQVVEKEDTIDLAKNGDLNNYHTYFKNELAKLLSCVWCTSVWVAFGMIAAHKLLSGWPAEAFELSVIILAVSAVAILLECHVEE